MTDHNKATVDSASPARKRVTSPALRRGLDILELFLAENRPLEVPEITAKLGRPRATVHELVSTLVEREYLRVLSERPTIVALGVKTLQLGGAYETNLDLAEFGRETARAVAGQCGETVQLVVRDGTQVLCLVRIDSTHSVRLVSEVGRMLPAHCTAGGKILLSELSEETLAALFPNDSAVRPMTKNSIDSRARLYAELEQTRARGWAEEHCESNNDVVCVAAPVFASAGRYVAAMSVSIPILRWDESQKDEYVSLVCSGARELSTRLGARPPSP